jgi:hypothetical protein
MIFDQITVLKEIEEHQTPELWIVEARKRSTELKALVNGENFAELLIQQIEKVESNNRAIARKKYSKDIRDLFSRVNKKRENVFQSNGGSEEIKIDSEELKTQFIKTLTHFKGGKSLFKYLSEYFFKQMDIDPNGVIFIEYKAEEGKELKVYPTYKSINDIRHYDANGQKCEYIIFEPKKKIENGNYFSEWRIVDAKTDWCIKQVGTTFIVDLEKSFEHPFGEVPAVILSDYIEIGKRERQNQLTPVVELAKDYARDKSILTIYKFQNGFPKHWQYVTQCRACFGTGKTGAEKCQPCNGTGILQKSDVTDIINLATPKEGDPVIAPNIAGFIQPDLDTWKQYKVDLSDFEKLIDDTLWGTNQVQQSKTSGETATGRFIDVQPVTNELNRLTDTVEWVHNTIANWVANVIVITKKKDEDVFHKSYGRRFIIESPDVILEKYEKARVDGSGTTILDKLMQEFILSKYKTDPMMQEKMLKKALVEPYIHYDIATVNTIFGKVEAYKKAIFGTFWETVDIEKTVEQLKTDFITYSNSEIAKNGIKPVETVI